jgi:hypothetical protein
MKYRKMLVSIPHIKNKQLIINDVVIIPYSISIWFNVCLLLYVITQKCVIATIGMIILVIVR